MHMVKFSSLVLLSLTFSLSLLSAPLAKAAAAQNAMEAKKAMAQEDTGKPKLPPKGPLRTIHESNEKLHCEKCHDKGEPECKACKDVKKRADKKMKAECNDCPDCKSGKKDCESCDHCQRKGYKPGPGDHPPGEGPKDGPMGGPLGGPGPDAPNPDLTKPAAPTPGTH
ncbi:MAG: hypothetical protein H7301_01255 [Cryobacterium sp.]|nr:hypothetical protein [Oligoflexia bacterium]